MATGAPVLDRTDADDPINGVACFYKHDAIKATNSVGQQLFKAREHMLSKADNSSVLRLRFVRATTTGPSIGRAQSFARFSLRVRETEMLGFHVGFGSPR